MMVEAPVHEVVLRAFLEIFEAARRRIHFQIVQLENLWEVRQIILTDVALKVLHKMREWGDRSVVVESAVLMRDYQNHDPTAILQQAFPFVQSQQWVGCVFEGMRGQ